MRFWANQSGCMALTLFADLKNCLLQRPMSVAVSFVLLCIIGRTCRAAAEDKKRRQILSILVNLLFGSCRTQEVDHRHFLCRVFDPCFGNLETKELHLVRANVYFAGLMRIP